MRDVIASEWYKLPNVHLLAATVLAALVCAGVAYLVGRGFDRPDVRGAG
ncbi:hypothetical protein ABZ907_37790 [Nonomuraea wenchangensis]